jgi:hypothetical protein
MHPLEREQLVDTGADGADPAQPRRNAREIPQRKTLVDKVIRRADQSFGCADPAVELEKIMSMGNAKVPGSVGIPTSRGVDTFLRQTEYTGLCPAIFDVQMNSFRYGSFFHP